jgi:glycosyltransferase involved in cell wall biosynthesis
VPLPAEAPAADPDAVAAGNRRLQVGRLPLILVVGSHEPRKNHMAVLHAAELLWREGQQFSLTFIGGNAWHSEPFVHRFGQLVGTGRALESFTAATDELLWQAYRAARFTVFPSFNEGFGLPVAESLACGTPVVTSNFGSMKEIADAGGGALLIDPRDDHDLLDAMRTLLTDDHLHAELAGQARSRPPRTWDDYADEVWAALASP